MRPTMQSCFRFLIGMLGCSGLLLAGQVAESQMGATTGDQGGTLVAKLNPVADDGRVDTKRSLGIVKFTQAKSGKGVDVLVQITSMTIGGSEASQASDGAGVYYPHGFHVHSGGSCEATKEDGKTVPAGAAGPHFDPGKTNSHKGPDGNGHAGDLPMVKVRNDGMGTLEASSSRLTLDQLAGKTVILHANPDNYTDTPPNGGSGGRIACGVIEPEKK